MNLQEFIQQTLETVEMPQPEKAVKLLSFAYIQKANIKNKILQIELQNIDPESRASIEKQQMKIAKQNEEYKQLLMELELIRAGINALEIFLKLHQQNFQEVI